MSWRTPFTELVGCAVPIQQAGFGSSANAPLAAAVSGAGGLGMLTAHGMTKAELGRAVDEVAAITPAPVGVNFIEPFFDRVAHHGLLEVAAARCRVVEFFYGEPDATLVDLVHDGGALACWQVGSVDEAVRAQECGMDLIVLQGIEAGGHVRATRGLLPMLSEVLPRMTVPVLAAGGIAAPRTMAAAMAAGAAGVRLGTRFVASVEADFHAGYKAALVAADGGDTVYTETFHEFWPDAPHRVLRSAVAAARASGRDVVGTMSVGGERMELPRFAGFAPVADAEGDVPAMALFAGEGVGDIEAILPAAEIVTALAAGAATLLSAAAEPL
ncbi:MAG: 2-nitropropane dioxygenase [Solirubrobacterales bacterium]|nr:2-nitropropane dioxygenase [Solirubrobacterales bacterium]